MEHDINIMMIPITKLTVLIIEIPIGAPFNFYAGNMAKETVKDFSFNYFYEVRKNIEKEKNTPTMNNL